MVIICSWCGRTIGLKKPIEDKRPTHGMCIPCAEKVKEELLEWRKEVKIDEDSDNI